MSISRINANSLATGVPTAAQLPSSGINASSLTNGTLAADRLPSGSIVQVQQKIVADPLTYSFTVGSIYNMSEFDFAFTPVSRSNYFLVTPCISVSGVNQHNSAFEIVENSSGSFDYIKNTSGTQIKNSSPASYTPSAAYNVLFSYGEPAISGINNENMKQVGMPFLTKLTTTSGSGSVTWRIRLFGGETSPLYVNYQASYDNRYNWSTVAVSTFTITEIKA
jgi:hypothetical protein